MVGSSIAGPLTSAQTTAQLDAAERALSGFASALRVTDLEGVPEWARLSLAVDGPVPHRETLVAGRKAQGAAQAGIGVAVALGFR